MGEDKNYNGFLHLMSFDVTVLLLEFPEFSLKEKIIYKQPSSSHSYKTKITVSL